MWFLVEKAPVEIPANLIWKVVHKYFSEDNSEFQEMEPEGKRTFYKVRNPPTILENKDVKEMLPTSAYPAPFSLGEENTTLFQ